MKQRKTELRKLILALAAVVLMVTVSSSPASASVAGGNCYLSQHWNVGTTVKYTNLAHSDGVYYGTVTTVILSSPGQLYTGNIGSTFVVYFKNGTSQVVGNFYPVISGPDYWGYQSDNTFNNVVKVGVNPMAYPSKNTCYQYQGVAMIYAQ